MNLNQNFMSEMFTERCETNLATSAMYICGFSFVMHEQNRFAERTLPTSSLIEIFGLGANLSLSLLLGSPLVGKCSQNLRSTGIFLFVLTDKNLYIFMKAINF